MKLSSSKQLMYLQFHTQVARLQEQLDTQATELAAMQESNQKLQERVQELHDTAKRLDGAGGVL